MARPWIVTKNKQNPPGNLNCNPLINGSGVNLCGPKANGWNPGCRIFDLGSLGPSTVTLIALVYDAIWTGFADITIVRLKLFPAIKKGCKIYFKLIIGKCVCLHVNFYRNK